MSLSSHPATACLLLMPRGQTSNRPLRPLLSRALFFSSHITLLCQCHLSSSPLFSSHCPPFSLFIFCWKLGAYLQRSASRAGSVMGTSVFRLMSLVWFINVQEGPRTASWLAVVSTTHTFIPGKHQLLLLLALVRFCEFISYHMLHLQTLKTLVPSVTPCLRFPSTLVLVHLFLNVLSQALHLSITLSLLSLHLPTGSFKVFHIPSHSIPASQSCGWGVWLWANCTRTSTRNGRMKTPLVTADASATAVCIHVCMRGTETEERGRTKEASLCDCD